MPRQVPLIAALALSSSTQLLSGVSAQNTCGGKNIPTDFEYNEDFNIYFKYDSAPRTWTDHESLCQAHTQGEGHLVTINSQEKNKWVLDMTETHAAIGYGRLDDADLSKFSWTSSPTW